MIPRTKSFAGKNIPFTGTESDHKIIATQVFLVNKYTTFRQEFHFSSSNKLTFQPSHPLPFHNAPCAMLFGPCPLPLALGHPISITIPQPYPLLPPSFGYVKPIQWFFHPTRLSPESGFGLIPHRAKRSVHPIKRHLCLAKDIQQ